LPFALASFALLPPFQSPYFYTVSPFLGLRVDTLLLTLLAWFLTRLLRLLLALSILAQKSSSPLWIFPSCTSPHSHLITFIVSTMNVYAFTSLTCPSRLFPFFSNYFFWKGKEIYLRAVINCNTFSPHRLPFFIIRFLVTKERKKNLSRLICRRRLFLFLYFVCIGDGD
jgi:hypothetical protein